eukprot:1015468-Pleurochrysis_carterae.AAC.2
MRLHFDGQSGALLRGSVERYLLEKSRVVTQEVGERSYHAFYQLCAGAPLELRERLLLHDGVTAEDFDYLTAGETVAVSGIDDADDFDTVDDALRAMHASLPDEALVDQDREGEGLWHCLAAILHLGNVRFQESASGVAGGGGASACLHDEDADVAAAAATLLGCETRKRAAAAVASADPQTSGRGGDKYRAVLCTPPLEC